MEGGHYKPPADRNPPKKRGGCLTAALLVYAVMTALACVTDLLFSRSIAAANPEGSSWTHAGIPGLGVVGLVALGALYLIWQWRRAGVYLYVGIGLVIFPINLAIIGPLPSLLGLAGVALIVALVSRQWRDFA